MDGYDVVCVPIWSGTEALKMLSSFQIILVNNLSG